MSPITPKKSAAQLWYALAARADEVRRGSTEMFNALRYYWLISKGHRFRPWMSPYIRWRMETFFGYDASDLTAAKFFSLMWHERARMERFLDWVGDQRERRQARKG